MSLKIWLPLDGTLTNKGYADVKFTMVNGGPAPDNDGIIGKCYYFDETTNNTAIQMPRQFDETLKEFSYTCWFKPVNTKVGALFSNRNTSNSGGLAIILNSNGKILFDMGARISREKEFDVGTWYHLGFTYQYPGKARIYINGELFYETNAQPATSVFNADYTYIGCTTSADGSRANWLNGWLNDVRIFDHCLSATEVREISRGLVLHYKLDDVNPNPNILLDSNESSLTKVYGSKDRYFESASSGTFTCEFEEISDPPAPGIKYGIHQTVTGASMFHSLVFYYMPAIEGTTYTMSCYVKKISGGSGLGFSFQHGRSPYDRQDITLIDDNKWHQYSYTFVADAENDINNLTRVYCGGLASVGEVLICGYKYEEGPVATRWIPNEVEPHYNEAINVIACDSSGYGRHGKIVGTPISYYDTPRYNASTYIEDGTVSKIETPSLSFYPRAITMNIWFKSTNTTPTGSYHMMVDSVVNRGWYEMDVYKDGRYRAGVYVNGTRRAATCTSNTGLDGNWHMYTLTYDGTNVNRYVDAELDTATEAVYTTGLPSPTALKIGCCGDALSYAVTEGSMSDFRIYATALSVADILNLYQAGMKVDKNGGFHAHEIRECDIESFHKTGVVTARNITEIVPNLHYDKNVYREPDGSLWVKIAMYNDPDTNGIFEQTDDFPHGVYKNASVWYDAEQVIANLSTYEFLVIQQATVGNTVFKHRWVQTINPLTAVYADVTPSSENITRVTTSGYSDSTTGGGMFLKNSYTRLCIADSASGHYYGAFGTWTLSSDKVPGYPGHTNISTGFLELYARIDNQPNNLGFKILKNSGIYADQFVEM